MPPTPQEINTPAKYCSTELKQLQARPDSPFGTQFFIVPVSSASLPIASKATTRSCEETSNDGKSTLDCVDDDD